MQPLTLLLSALLAALPALSLPASTFDPSPNNPLQHIIGRPRQHHRGPGISPAPHAGMVGVRFRVLAETDGNSGGVGWWRTIETFLPVGVELRVAEHPLLPSRPEALQITSIPKDGLHLSRQCFVHPSFDEVAAKDTLKGLRADMVVVGDEDGEVPLYKHSEGGLMAEEQDVVAYYCF